MLTLDERILNAIPLGWHVLMGGCARIGDRWWRSSAKNPPGYFLPVTGADWQGESASDEGTPVIIRKER